MKLEQSISITPPPFSSHDGKIINPEPIIFHELDVSYIDKPKHKKVFAQIDKIPFVILLLENKDYDNAGDYSQIFIENKLREYLGDNPAQKLRSLFPKTLEENPNGPGSILAGMFGIFGIKSSPTCSCRKHALEMNEKGNDWCEQNIDTIIVWLKDESNKRKLPFIESLAKMIVKKAIQKSRNHNYEI